MKVYVLFVNTKFHSIYQSRLKAEETCKFLNKDLRIRSYVEEYQLL